MKKLRSFYIDEDNLKHWEETEDKSALINKLMREHFNPDKLALEDRIRLIDSEIEDLDKQKSKLKNMLRIREKREEEILKDLMPELKEMMHRPPPPSNIPNHFLKKHGVIRTMKWIAEHWEDY